MQKPLESSSAARRVLQPIFGKYWRWWIAILTLSVFLPALVFWRQVAFDPAHFVEEWTKLGLTTICVFLFIEILQERRHAESHKHRFREFATAAVLEPLCTLAAKLLEGRAALSVGCSSDLSQLLADCASEALKIGSALDLTSVLGETLTFHNRLKNAALGLDSASLADSLMGLSNIREWGTVPLADFDYILGNLQRVIDALQRDLVAWQH